MSLGKKESNKSKVLTHLQEKGDLSSTPFSLKMSMQII